MPPPIRRRTTKKESRLAPWPTAALEERTEEIMDRVREAGDNHVERVAALEGYLTLACAHEGATWFRCRGPGARTLPTAIALGRVDDAVRMISDVTRSGCAEGTEMLCEPTEKLPTEKLPTEKLVCSGQRAPGQAPVTAGSRRLPGRRLGLCPGWHRVRRHRRPHRSPGIAGHRAGAGVAHR